MATKKGDDSRDSRRFTEATVEDVERIASALKPDDGTVLSQARQMVEYSLGQVLVGVYEVLDAIKSTRLNGPLSIEEIDHLVPKLRLCNKMLVAVIEDYMPHDAEDHVEIDDGKRT